MRNTDKLKKVLTWCNEKKFNTIFLQETFVTSDIVKPFNKNVKEYGNVFHSTTYTSHGRGVAIILSNTFPDYKVLDVHTDSDGRRVLLNIEIISSKTVLTLISIYAPNDVNHRINFFNELETWIEKYSKAPNNIIIGGDFNCDVNQRQSKD